METGVAWKQIEWKRWKTYLSMNKEVFDAELHTLSEVLGIALREERTGRRSPS